jgi:hypothetical protein
MVGLRNLLLAALLVLASLAAAACGSDDEESAGADGASATSTQAAEPGLDAIKQYLLDHTAALQGTTGELAKQGEQYYALAEEADFDYAALLDSKRAEVSDLITSMQETWQKANPQYEEAEGVVAGVPSLSEFDVIIDAGSDASDPESAVPFDVKLPDGKVLKQPGNFFFLTETSLFGTNKDFQAKGVEADLDGDGSVEFPEALPDAGLVMAVTRDFAGQARDLHASARKWAPTKQDALQALVTMTPTMSEYFGQWKNSRFIAGAKADEASFAASSRLKDIEDILSGLVLVYGNVEKSVAEVDEAQAKQTGEELTKLRDFATDLRKKEDSGTKFTAEQADTLGGEAQGRAEAIAGQISQAASQLGIELES